MTFDPQKFIDATTASPMSTQIKACPEGTYTALIYGEGDLKDWFREVEWKDKKTGEPRSAPSVRIPFLITDDGVKQSLSRDTVIVPFDIFLDLDAAGNLDTSEGKNVKLGQVRDAVGQNGSGPWNFSMLRGAGPLMVKVSQRSDPKDPKIKYAQVDRVARLT